MYSSAYRCPKDGEVVSSSAYSICMFCRTCTFSQTDIFGQVWFCYIYCYPFIMLITDSLLIFMDFLESSSRLNVFPLLLPSPMWSDTSGKTGTVWYTFYRLTNNPCSADVILNWPTLLGTIKAKWPLAESWQRKNATTGGICILSV